MRLLLMGTGAFAEPAFHALHETEHEVVGLCTQPDRTGRGHHRHRNPLKEFALERGTPVLQPENVNTPETIDAITALEPDLTVVAAYGQILRPRVIDAPRLGTINLHGSLLPKYRGAAPVQYAIWKGEAETGVTIFKIEPKLDAGPILGVARTPIDPKETSGELMLRLADLAVPLTIEVVDGLAAGTLEPLPQDPALVTKAPRLEKSDGIVDWSETTHAIDCRIRAMQPWPKPSSFLVEGGDDEPHRLLVLEIDEAMLAGADNTPPGTVVEVEADRLVVRTGDGCAAIVRVQPEGKRAMEIAEFLRGHAVSVGDRFVGP